MKFESVTCNNWKQNVYQARGRIESEIITYTNNSQLTSSEKVISNRGREMSRKPISRTPNNECRLVSTEIWRGQLWIEVSGCDNWACLLDFNANVSIYLQFDFITIIYIYIHIYSKTMVIKYLQNILIYS